MSRSIRIASLALLCAFVATLAAGAERPGRAGTESPTQAPSGGSRLVRSQAPADDPEPVFAASKPGTLRGVAPFENEPTTKRVRYVDADLSAFPAPGRGTVRRQLKLDLFDDVEHTAVLDKTAEVAPGVVSWNGHVKGVPMSDANFIVQDGVLAGSVRMPGASYEVRWASEGTYAIVEVDESKLPDEHPSDHPHGMDAPADAYDPSDSATVQAASDDGTLIDLMIVYTDDARAAAGGTSQIQSNMQLAVAQTNTAYQNSNVTQRLRLVHQAEVAYAETQDMGLDLSRVTNAGDGHLDEIHSLRDAYGADLVTFVTNTPDYACGLGWIMQQVSTGFAPYAFNVSRRGCVTTGLTMAHELGHNMGLMHDRFVEPADGAFAYSHGFVDPSIPRRWRTVMAYNDLCAPATCTRLQYFSNPDLIHDGDAMGLPEGHAKSADARKSLNNTALTVANFRNAPAPCTDDPSEPNNSRTAATLMSSGQTKTGTVCPGNDDFFSTPTATAGQTITFDLDHSYATGDLDMVLQNGAGTVLASSTSNDDDERIVYVVASAGTYYARVYGYQGATNTYGVTLTVADPPPAPDLTISTSDSPDPLTAGEALTYSTLVVNEGTGAAGAVTIEQDTPEALTSDPVVAGVINDDAGLPLSCSYDASRTYEVRCTATALGVGDHAEMTVRADVPLTILGPLSSTARASTAGDSDSTAVTTTVHGPGGPEVVKVTKRGRGRITSSEPTALIVCGPDCSDAYIPGSTVVLSARPKRGYRFVRWNSGPCATSGKTCTFTVVGPTAIKAIFRPR